MEPGEVRKLIVDIISGIALDEDPESFDNLKDDVPLRQQLDLDSMDFLDIVMELKKRYKIHVPQEDYPQLESLASCVAYLSPKFS